MMLNKPNDPPGFTAEASLYRTSENYHMVGPFAFLADGREVLPQWCIPLPHGGRLCCICHRLIGCFCDSSPI
jgi:hypothetical protein